MHRSGTSRRRFLIQTVATVGALPILGTLAIRSARAALPRLPATNAQAKALSYVEDAAAVTSKMFKPGSNCANCQFFVADTEACQIFPGFSVAPNGWCSGWALKKP